MTDPTQNPSLMPPRCVKIFWVCIVPRSTFPALASLLTQLPPPLACDPFKEKDSAVIGVPMPGTQLVL